MNWTWFHRLASPPSFHRFADRVTPYLWGASILLFAYGLVGGLWLAPPDYQQGEAFRIIYVHVPSAWMSLFLYTFMAGAAFVALVWRMKLAESVVLAVAPIGASFTALALATGMLWGKPMWGAYWVWDARLTSELILLFLYLGVIALGQAIADPRAAARAAGILALVGVVNVPIVHYSVEWWNSLHQTATIAKIGKPSIAAEMLWPLLSMALACTFFSFAAILRRMQLDNLMRSRRQSWVRELHGAKHV
jgi:heme exporter protein C